MKNINHIVLILGLLGSGTVVAEEMAPEPAPAPAATLVPGAPTTPVQLTVDYVEEFLKEAKLQVCAIEEIKPASSPWKGTIASYWVEIAPDCSRRSVTNPDIARIQQFETTADRDALVKYHRTNAPRGINLRAAIWPVGNFSAIALIGPNLGKNKIELQKVYEKRLAAGKKAK